MLLIPDLKTFADAFMAERPNIENVIVVASDDQAGRYYKNTANTGNNCTLIVVIPTHDTNIKDEDTKKMKNNLLFMIVKKTDDKSGNTIMLDNFSLCQIEILALLNKIINLHANFGSDCLFKDIDLTNAPINPVQDYFKGNGYMLDISTNTTF